MLVLFLGIDWPRETTPTVSEGGEPAGNNAPTNGRARTRLG
jgi:hypothetical protein